MRDKSDAQLDAESERCPDCDKRHVRCLFCDVEHGHDLAARIVCHRAAMLDNNWITHLVSRQPPMTRYDRRDFTEGDPDRYGADNEFVIEPGAASGMSTSGAMLRRLSDSPGAVYSWADAFGWLHWQCRLRHYKHRASDRPYWRGRLCWQAVKLTVVGSEKGHPIAGPLTVEQAATILRVENMLDPLGGAFDDIEARIKYVESRAERKAREDEGHGPGAVPKPVAVHHAPSQEHIAECPNEECRARRNAA